MSDLEASIHRRKCIDIIEEVTSDNINKYQNNLKVTSMRFIDMINENITLFFLQYNMLHRKLFFKRL